jgi:phage repressor protein C with HTH and peptisase S24 domain
VAIAQLLGVHIQWLATGQGPMRAGEVEPSARPELPVGLTAANFTFLPYYDLAVSAGAGVFALGEPDMGYLAFRRDWIKRELRADPANLFLVAVQGESMIPILQPEDLLIVDKSDHARQADGIYVLRIDHALMVKRLQRMLGGRLRISSENPRYEPMEIGPEPPADFAIIGRAIWCVSGRKL